MLNAVALAIFLALNLVLGALLFGWAYLPTSPEHGDLPSSLQALAGYGGALFGFVAAVAFFSVQVRSQKDDSALPLIPILARRQLTFFVLALVAGVTIGNILVLLASQILPIPAGTVYALTWANLLAVPAVTLISLWFIASTMTHASDSDMEMAIPVLQSTMSAQSRQDALRVDRFNTYVGLLQEAGIEYSPYADTPTLLGSRPTARIPFRKEGTIADIDCFRLQKLQRILLRLPSQPSASLAIAYEQDIGTDDALILTWNKPGDDALRLSDAQRETIASALNRAFILTSDRQRLPAEDVRKFLARLESMLRLLARQARHVELESRLFDVQALLDAWLEVAPPNAHPPPAFRYFEVIERFGGPLEINLRSVADSAQLSEDSSTVVVLADHLARDALACLTRRQQLLATEMLDVLSYFYYRCVRTPNVSGALAHRIDSSLHSLFLTISIRESKSKADSETSGAKEETSALLVALRFTLSLVHSAIRYGNAEHARFFLERLFYSRRNGLREHDRATAHPSPTDQETVLDYIAVLLLGWSIYVLNSGAAEDDGAAKEVVQVCRQHLPPVPVLLAEWELFRGTGWREIAIELKLGVDHWNVQDWAREQRVGVTEVSYGGVDWAHLGLRCALLLARKDIRSASGGVFGEAPGRHVWNIEAERDALEGLAAEENLGIPLDERESRIRSVLGLIRTRARQAESEFLRHVMDSPVDSGRACVLREHAIAGFLSHCTWQRAIYAAGVSRGMTTSSRGLLKWGHWIPRELLLEHGGSVESFALNLGRDVAIREAVHLLSGIERAAPRIEDLECLARLPEVVRLARRRLVESGFRVSIIVLPREERFAKALFGRPLWRIEKRSEFSDASVGVWEGVHVLRFPYTDPTSILVIDTAAAVAGDDPSSVRTGIDVVIDELASTSTSESVRRQATNALRDAQAELPDPHRIQVLARMDVVPRVVLANERATLSIGITSCDGGFALSRESMVYHRPSCEEIEYEDVEFVLALPPDQKFSACSSCRPDALLGGGSTDGSR